MALDWKYSENGKHIILVDGEPKSKKKITGTRLAAVLGLNPWSTPFQMWCEITKAASLPFEDTMYTLAGKAIEPKQIAYTKEVISENILSPEEFFGNRYESVKYDFYPNEKIFGGMWDAKMVRSSGKVSDIFEFKTTKRSEDWKDGVPINYLIQALEYAYLEGAKRVHLVVSFLEEDDYNHPENFKVTDENTQIFTYTVSDTYINTFNGDVIVQDNDGYRLDNPEFCDIEDLIVNAWNWYDVFIKSGISPEFDEEKDAEYLDILRTTNPGNDSSLEELVEKSNSLREKIAAIKAETGLSDLENTLKAHENAIKKELKKQLSDSKTKCVFENYTLTRSFSEKITFNEDAMKDDGVYEKYAVVKNTVKDTLRKK